ncbi:MAG: UDP-N-acetylglucosamine 1-carboxyvinyltransferase [Clostridiales bacterium]|nr:UDP-N-acetylglucosamine 1-carboxyvinyltransferase [Clostridiales bacterium]
MSVLRIQGGRKLSGSIRVQGAKNSVLPIMAASLLAEGVTVIHNCPDLSDVEVSMKILRHLGCKAQREGESVVIDSAGEIRHDIPDDLMREMRSSVVFMGAIFARTGKALMSYPGGCELGPRPIDLHLYALRTLGALIDETGGRIACHSDKLAAGYINFSLPSVGATENAMLAASRAVGTTVITNPAREPEIEDLQSYLRGLGIDINGAGTSMITVTGRRTRKDTEHTIIPDRIVAATWLSALASAGGDIELTGVEPSHFASVADSLRRMGCTIEADGNRVRALRNGMLRAIKPIYTEPYPGFPTDAQPPLMAAALCAQGTTVFVENIFENRYRHVEELRRMGADIMVSGKTAMVCGVRKLHGAGLRATDLRGSAALLVAALAAEGESIISGLSHLDRGYDGTENILKQLGADIERMD